MSIDPKQQLDKTTKIIGFRVTEEELQNVIYPVMHDCYDLGIIDHDTLTSFLRFCVQFWMGHYRMKKQQFDMVQEEIEEKEKLVAIASEKEGKGGVREELYSMSDREGNRCVGAADLRHSGHNADREPVAQTGDGVTQPQRYIILNTVEDYSDELAGNGV